MERSPANARIEFVDKKPISFDLLTDPSEIDNVFFIKMNEFRRFINQIYQDTKKIKSSSYFNSLIEQLISVYQECPERNAHTETLTQILMAKTIVVTDLPSNVFLKKLRKNKFTDDINYLVLPNFILWDQSFIMFLNKSFNARHEHGLVDINGAMQKIKLTHGIIKDQFQSKNGYAGQFIYSTFLNTGSFYANVQCLNGPNIIIPPKSSVERYYGRQVDNVRAWTTRHPNISQLSTQVSDVIQSENYTDWNVKVGLGIFTGANTDCDGDKKVITYLPQPNSLIDLECLLYGDPRYNFICFDKNRLSFVSQQIFYLYRKRRSIKTILNNMPLVEHLWDLYKNIKFSQKLDMLLRDCALVLSSNFSYLLFNKLTELIDNEEMVCGEKEIRELGGQFNDMIASGAKGSVDLIKSTHNYRQTKTTDVNEIAERAIKSLNNYISSHNRVKVGGGDIYHNTTVLQNLYLKNDYICYKNDSTKLTSICALPSEFLFPEHLLDLFL
ncbi:LEF-9 [Chrysodeixis includens nucleopolyhedrovirus]|uniref:LEF-9 n=1 Tax=Chrysodeixis includens nucleopolyhedrovirus TaxID=1207438 RepID=A0A5B8YRT0_9ABAC|nr:LEF-9 [Chrysodeixis includens nucleopolyhedrovirus]QED40576.1 LEF-9 [Chrysodeixis includens nucleopolyhedrovirus]